MRIVKDSPFVKRPSVMRPVGGRSITAAEAEEMKQKYPNWPVVRVSSGNPLRMPNDAEIQQILDACD